MKYKCQAQIEVEKEFEATSEEAAETAMALYMKDEYADLDWCISVFPVV
jgi:hypothetical protein